MSNTIIRAPRRYRFVTINQDAVEDSRLSWAARGLLGYLLSRPDDWKVLIKDLQHRGDLGRDGIYKLMEVNGRHNLSGILAVRCGLNFPLIQYRHLTEGALPETTTFRSGVYWTDFYRDAGYSVAFFRSDRYSPRAYVAPYARRHCDAIFDRHDMGPFWARFRFLARSAGASARRSLIRN